MSKGKDIPTEEALSDVILSLATGQKTLLLVRRPDNVAKVFAHLRSVLPEMKPPIHILSHSLITGMMVLLTAGNSKVWLQVAPAETYDPTATALPPDVVYWPDSEGVYDRLPFAKYMTSRAVSGPWRPGKDTMASAALYDLLTQDWPE